jgi:hypothetical protein
VINVMDGPNETPDRARLELQEDSLAVVVLSARDSATFAGALLHPKPVNTRLRDTIRRYRELTGISRGYEERDLLKALRWAGGRLYAEAHLSDLCVERYIYLYSL